MPLVQVDPAQRADHTAVREHAWFIAHGAFERLEEPHKLTVATVGNEVQERWYDWAEEDNSPSVRVGPSTGSDAQLAATHDAKTAMPVLTQAHRGSVSGF